MKQKRTLHILFSFFILQFLFYPTSIFAYSKKIIPGGETIGIELKTDGIMVVGFYQVNGKMLAKDAGFELGDRITKVNGEGVTTIEGMITKIKEQNKDQVTLSFMRGKKEHNTSLSLVKDDTGTLKTGLFVKDQISGIGTLTYLDPTTQIYGALGHEIADKNTLSKVELKTGKIFYSSITGITKSVDGAPGEKNAKFNSQIVFGNLRENEKSGIFGTYGETLQKDAVEVAEADDVKLGEASIRTVIEGTKVEDFKINILKVDKENDTKNILFEITDTTLLSKTGGIVQGMSGSPIMQNGKIIGAVTHVIVNDSKKGYGIFITTMLKEGEN